MTPFETELSDRCCKLVAVLARMEITLEQADKLLESEDFNPREIGHIRASIARRMKESAELFDRSVTASAGGQS